MKSLPESGDVVQLVRTPACHVGGRGFEPRRPRHSFQFLPGQFEVGTVDVYSPVLRVAITLFGVTAWCRDTCIRHHFHNLGSAWPSRAPDVDLALTLTVFRYRDR